MTLCDNCKHVLKIKRECMSEFITAGCIYHDYFINDIAECNQFEVKQ